MKWENVKMEIYSSGLGKEGKWYCIHLFGILAFGGKGMSR